MTLSHLPRKPTKWNEAVHGTFKCLPGLRKDQRVGAMKATIKRDRDLVGATPNKLARALLKQPDLRPRPAGKAVVGDEVAVKKAATNKARNSVPHLRKRY